jgi:tetratricopeptide (TPR) repeat protein
MSDKPAAGHSERARRGSRIQSRRGALVRIILAVLCLLTSGSSALAKIQFCNDFEHPIFVALAYQQKGEWITEGWLEVDVNSCVIDPKHQDVTSFYYYCETNTFDKKSWNWGKDKQFSVKNDDFTLHNADKPQPGGRFLKFSGPEDYKLPETVVQVRFNPDLSTTFIVPSENKGGGSGSALDSAQDACDNQSGDAAIAGCSTLISNNPNDEKAYFNRGVEYADKNDHDRAIADFSKAISIKPDYARAYNSRGHSFYVGKDDYSHAISDYTKAIDLDSQLASALVNRGNVYRFIHAYAVALNDLNAAISLDPKSNAAFYFRAQVYEGLERKNDAIADYRQALVIDPTDQDSKDALKRLGVTP